MDDKCLLLPKSIYGLVQASWQWRRILISILKKSGFKVSEVDPCLMWKQCELGFVLCGFDIDDRSCIGAKRVLLAMKQELKKHFAIKFAWVMTEYIGCTLKKYQASMKIYISHPELISTLERGLKCLDSSESGDHTPKSSE